MKKIMFNDKFRFTPAARSPLLRFLPSFGGAGGDCRGRLILILSLKT